MEMLMISLQNKYPPAHAINNHVKKVNIRDNTHNMMKEQRESPRQAP